MVQLDPSLTPTTALPLASADETLPFVCRRSDNVFVAIEKCLDNGLGACLLLDDNGCVIGRITLDEIRRAIRDGRVLADASLERYASVDPGSLQRKVGAARNGLGDDAVLKPVLDGKGRLIDIVVDHSRRFVQVARPGLSHREFRAMVDAFLSGWISSKGPRVSQFEERFAAYAGMRNAVAVSNGTAALHLALRALGISEGDEVVVPDLTFAATINAVLYCGATPVIADIDATSWTLTVEQVARVMTPRTKAIVPVHLYGRPAEIGPLAEFARRHGCFIVEDCAEALGARYAGSLVGTFGAVSCFSFYANKIVTTGEGGICLTNSQSAARLIIELRNHGVKPGSAYWHDRVGYNYGMTNLQAAIGVAQIGHIDRVLQRNRRLEQTYRDRLAAIPGVTFPPQLPPLYEAVTWLVCVQVPPLARARLIECARHADIEIRPFFHPLSALPIYERYARPCRNSIVLSRTGVNLPTSSAVDDNVIEKIRDVFLQVLG
ncbi:MAG: aminotransferase class I/II-fold pyridoxal phosphate-dependent enzyme [Vulcanimicrobiaceae bacterium]